LDKFLKDKQMMNKGNDYRTVAVIGCQSSGKSEPIKLVSLPLYLGTILNLLFSTKFDVMDGDEGRTQTTKGVWMAVNSDSNILVFDIEGTDSKERGDQRVTFE
jgi:hypothetical protein